MLLIHHMMRKKLLDFFLELLNIYLPCQFHTWWNYPNCMNKDSAPHFNLLKKMTSHIWPGLNMGDDANFVNANIYWAHFILILPKIESWSKMHIPNKMIFLLYTGTSALIIYFSNIQGTKKYSAVMYLYSGWAFAQALNSIIRSSMIYDTQNVSPTMLL